MNLALLSIGILAVVVVLVALFSHTTDPEVVDEMEGWQNPDA